MEQSTNKFFECTVKSLRAGEDGIEKSFTDIITVSAVNFTDAEATILSFCEDTGLCTPEIKNITPAPYKSAFPSDRPSDNNKWYKAKTVFVVTDDTGKEKKSAEVYLIEARDFDAALRSLHKIIDSSPTECRAMDMKETKIASVLK